MKVLSKTSILLLLFSRRCARCLELAPRAFEAERAAAASDEAVEQSDAAMQEASDSLDQVQESMGKNTTILYQSRSEEEMLSTEADLTKAQELIGYKPQWNLVRGLQSMLTPALS